MTRIDARLADLRKQLDVATPELAAAQAKWEVEFAAHAVWTVARRLVPPAPASVFAALDTSPEKRTPEQQARLAGYYRGVAPATKATRDEIARLEKSRPLPAMLPVMVELPPERHRTTNVMVKGNFLDKGDKVEPGVPSSFHPLPQGAKLDRLGVAKWVCRRTTR